MKNAKNLTTLSQEEILLGKLKEISSLAPYCEKPPEGWIISLGAALGLDCSGLSQKLNMSIEKIHLLEQKTKAPVGLNRIAKAFGGRFQYIFIPKDMNDATRQDAVKRFKKLSLLPQKPDKGWLKAIRKAWGIPQKELAQRVNYSSPSPISLLETAEKNDQIWPIFLESILQTMNCRAELIFIPENMNLIQNAFENQKKNVSLKKTKKKQNVFPRKSKAQKSLKSEKLRTHSSWSKRPFFPIQFEQLTLLPKRSPGSYVQMLRKKNGLTQAALAKKMGCRYQEIVKIEKAEREKKVPYPPLEKIAHALGCHLNYLFIPNKDSPHYPNLDEDLGKEYDLTFQAAQQTPSEGWIAAIRKVLQFSREDLAKRMGINVSQIDIYERDEKNDELIFPILKKVAQGLDCQVRLMFVPEQAFFDELSPSHRKHFEKISSSFRKPPEGWIQFIRTIHQINRERLTKVIKAKNEQITYVEACEVKNTLVRKKLQKIAHALGGRFECVFIPNTPLSYSSSMKQLYQVFPIPLKPATGWIKAIRLARGLSLHKLAIMAHILDHQVYRSEKFESQNVFSSCYFQKIAEALGGRFEYVLIPDKQPLPRSRSLVPLPAFPNHPKSIDREYGIMAEEV